MKTVFTVSFFVCMMLIASIAWSDIIHVPSDYDTIQEAIDAAVDGDIISVEYAVHTEAGITVNKDLTVQGYGISNTIVQAAETVDQATDRVFKISSGNVTIKDMTIRHGKIDNYYGGGILNLGTLTLTNCTVSGNKVSGDYAYGGGIASDNILTLTNCTVSENKAVGYTAYGGGIFVTVDSSLEVTNCTVNENQADADGGGIWIDGWVDTVLTNCIVSGNQAYYGGGIYNWGILTLTNCTISGNQAVGDYAYGGGIMSEGTLDIKNTILWDDSPQEIVPDFLTITYSDIQDGWEGEGNIDADPLFVDPDNGDYHLQAGSPCIDAGDPASPEDPDGTRADMGAFYFDQSAPLPGDVSGNGYITAHDAALILQYIVGLRELSEKERDVADVTGDGTVTALDAALILQYTVGLIIEFPVQQAAPIFTVKDENQILTKIIAELENISLTTEQKHVLEQLKHLIGQQSIPEHTSLLQNYPNPFNPETWLPYQLAQDASVTICIYNVKGQLVRTLHLGNKNAGVYTTKAKSAHWDGRDNLGQSVASGMYFYTLQVEYPGRDRAGAFTTTRKMVIVK